MLQIFKVNLIWPTSPSRDFASRKRFRTLNRLSKHIMLLAFVSKGFQTTKVRRNILIVGPTCVNTWGFEKNWPSDVDGKGSQWPCDLRMDKPCHDWFCINTAWWRESSSFGLMRVPVLWVITGLMVWFYLFLGLCVSTSNSGFQSVLFEACMSSKIALTGRMLRASWGSANGARGFSLKNKGTLYMILATCSAEGISPSLRTLPG